MAPNSVTLGENGRPLEISKFIKDIHAGFQLLNLKNDALRRRSDTIKYSVRRYPRRSVVQHQCDSLSQNKIADQVQVKKVEDVVYDLSLRGLLPKAE